MVFAYGEPRGFMQVLAGNDFPGAVGIVIRFHDFYTLNNIPPILSIDAPVTDGKAAGFVCHVERTEKGEYQCFFIFYNLSAGDYDLQGA